MRTTRTLLLVVSLLMLGETTQVVAQEDEAADEQYELMLRLSDEATEAVMEEEFELAAVKFRQAYRAYPDPILLKNEMISWYRAGDCRSALPSARAFLQSDDVQPSDRQDVTTVELDCHLALAESALGEENLILAGYYLDILGSIANTARSLERYDALRAQFEELQPVEEESFPVEFPPQQGWSRRDLGWIQVTAGLATGATGVVLHGVALDRQEQLREFARSNDPAEIEVFRRRESEWGNYQRVTSWLVPTLYVLGGVVLGSGSYFLLTSETYSQRLTVTPAMSAESLGLRIGGRF